MNYQLGQFAYVVFDCPPKIRKAIYTTNSIKSLNRVILCAVAHCKLFPSDESAMKVIYLTISQAAKKWTMPDPEVAHGLKSLYDPIQRTYLKVQLLIMPWHLHSNVYRLQINADGLAAG